MRKTALLVLLLAGCAGGVKPPHYGSFTTAGTTADGKKIADDTVKELVTLYPPAITRFHLQQAAPDTFGTAFVGALRSRGYGLQEQGAIRPGRSGDAGKGTGRALSYVFDQPGGTDLYRGTLTIDGRILSRVYQSSDGGVAPAGAWTRTE